MGVVYKSEDTKLKRTVALKFLPHHLLANEEDETRFLHEARAASALNHPNIMTIHEIDDVEGETFIAMELVEGVTLKDKLEKGPLKTKELLNIAIAVADGLNAAHRKDIVHRDIKSENIMISTDGLVKIMDFGLAKLGGDTSVTDKGSITGTAVYMSPEQARGEDVDQRTDIWSLGVVLYEMISGQPPFKGEYEAAVIYSILNEDAEPLTARGTGVPIELQRIVNKAMEKERRKRYQTLADMLLDLRSFKTEFALGSVTGKTPGTKPRSSIAVLPFADMSPEKDQDYFCDGLAEEIINAFTKVEGLHVVARTSSFAFKGKNEDVRQVGKKLNVSKVLEGSVRKAGDNLRVTTQLVDVVNGFHIWSERYERQMEDVFAIQDDISQAIVGTLKEELVLDQNVTLDRQSRVDLEAYTLYLKGRFHWNKRTEEGLLRAIEHFERAIAKDSDFSLAHVGIADSHNILGYYSFVSPKEAFPRAKATAVKALDLDNMLAEAHASLAFVRLFYDWDWSGAEREFKTALELNPGYATAHHWYAEYLALVGRPEEAIEEAERALKYDPLSLIINTLVGWVYYYGRQYDQAIRKLRNTLELDPNFVPANFWLGLAHQQISQFGEAIAVFQKAITHTGKGAVIIAALGCAYALSGETSKAEQKLGELKEETSKGVFVPSYYIAAIHACLGEKNQALECLKNAYRVREMWLVFLKVDPIWDKIRSDQQFVELLKKVGL